MNAKAYVKPLIITVLGPTLVDGTSVRSTAALAAAARAGYLRASHVRLDTLSSVRISGGAAFGRLRRAVCLPASRGPGRLAACSAKKHDVTAFRKKWKILHPRVLGYVRPGGPPLGYVCGNFVHASIIHGVWPNIYHS